MLFPTSGVEVHPVLPFVVALVVSFFTSMGGVSGAFLLLPFQVSFLGYTAPSVSATNQVFNIFAIPSGVYRYIQEGRMLWPLTRAVVIGTLPGVFVGAWIRINYLPEPKNFKLFCGLVLLYIGWRLLRDIRCRRKNEKQCCQPTGASSTVKILESTMTRVCFEYNNQVYGFSPYIIYILCLSVGLIGGVYGIGGGAIVAPFLVTIIGLPVYTVAGASLMGTFITSIAGVAFYHALAPLHPETTVAPDWSLGALFGLGGLVGMYLGARAQRFVPARAIKALLCGCVLFAAGSYIVGFFL